MLRNNEDTFWPFRIVAALLAGGVVYLAVRLVAVGMAANEIYQEIVPLGKISYNEDFLKEAAEIEGLLSVSPVLEIPVSLKLGDYTMETVLQAVDLEELRMEGYVPEEVPFGNTPVLLIGEKALSAMTDAYGHSLSEKEQQKFWETEGRKLLEYKQAEQEWQECEAAGLLTVPDDGIYIACEQGEKLLEGEERTYGKILVTMQGRKWEEE